MFNKKCKKRYEKLFTIMDTLVKEGDYWVVYRNSDTWGDCPIFKSKSKEQAEILL